MSSPLLSSDGSDRPADFDSPAPLNLPDDDDDADEGLLGLLSDLSINFIRGAISPIYIYINVYHLVYDRHIDR